MKTTRLLTTAALLIASTSLSFAGPGAQYWQQRRNSPAPTTTVVASGSQSDVKATDAAQPIGCQGCTSCKAKG